MVAGRIYDNLISPPLTKMFTAGLLLELGKGSRKQ